MKISLEWISDFVDLSGLDPERIAERMTLATAEVEGIHEVSRSLEGVVVGEVIAAEPLNRAGEERARLHRVEVIVGGVRFATVCGAPNVRVGMKSPFAKPGCVLADGSTVTAAEIAGVRSEGILCSPAELGLSRFHDGLLVCPSLLESGTPLSKLIAPRDVLLEVDNKSLTHRPDLWGHYGFARELAATFGRPLLPLPQADLGVFDGLPPFPVHIEDAGACPCYACLVFEVTAATPSPLTMQVRLHALGQRTYNLMVDVTNYVMLELGQPTHAFDARHLSGVRVATCGRPMTFRTLDGQDRAMTNDDLMIWDGDSRPVAIAGVMGGENSQIDAGTTRVMLESANFKGSRVRKTSVRLGLRTDAAQRYEKNQPPANVRTAAGRILRLVQDAGSNPKVVSRFSTAGDLKEGYRPISLPAGLFQRVAGAAIADSTALDILRSLGFHAGHGDDDSLTIGIPPFRSETDLSIIPDIVEEVLRVYGYDRVEPKVPAAPMAPVPLNPSLRAEHKARRVLATAHRFTEVHTYIWMDDPWIAALGFDPGATLNLRNPSAEGKRRLRTSMLPNLLALVPQNRGYRDAFRLFEIGRVFHPTSDGGCQETTRLGGLSYTPDTKGTLEEHFRSVKGAIEDVSVATGAGPLRFAEPADVLRTAPWEADGSWVAAFRGSDPEPVGSVGILGGPTLRAVDPDGQIVWFEVELPRLTGPTYPATMYRSPPVYPGSWQDFSLVWDLDAGYARLEGLLAGFSHPLVRSIDFLYMYKGKGIAEGKGSYTFRVGLGADDRTLDGTDLERFHASFAEFLTARGVTLR